MYAIGQNQVISLARFKPNERTLPLCPIGDSRTGILRFTLPIEMARCIAAATWGFL